MTLPPFNQQEPYDDEDREDLGDESPDSLYEYVVERNRKYREAYWKEVGSVSETAFFGPTNGPMSPWPGCAENYVPIWTPDSLILTTDGLSSPWSDDDEEEDEYILGDTGEEFEIYIDSPRLRGASMEEIGASWELNFLMRSTSHYVGQDFRPSFDFYGCMTQRSPEVDVPPDWIGPDGNFASLLGSPSATRADVIEIIDDKAGDDAGSIRFMAITPIRPDELEWAIQNDARTELGEALSRTPYRNQVHWDRPSIISTINRP